MLNRLEPVGRGGAARRFDEVLLEVQGITLRFGGVSARSDVSFDIRKGEIRSTSARCASSSRRARPR